MPVSAMRQSPHARFQDVVVSFRADPKGPRIGRPFVGFSYEKSQMSGGFFSSGNEVLVRLFNDLGPGILRIGGNSVDKTFWQPGAPASRSGAVTEADVDALGTFLAATGWTVLYGLNLARNTPAGAAQEAAYAARILGPHLYAFEIGNEPDAYSLNGTRPATYTYRDFLVEWGAFADSVSRAAPQVMLSGPASAWHEASWTEPFAGDESRRITLLTQHYYRANGLSPQSTLALLLAGDPALPGLLAGLREASTRAGLPLGYRLTEANSFYDGGAPNISNTFGAALWALDFLFIAAACGASGVNLHGGGAAPGYTPIADDGRTVIQIRPEYFAMLFFTLVGEGKLVHAAQRLGRLAVSTYLVQKGSQRRLLIANKDPLEGVNIVLPEDFISEGIEVTRLSAPSLTSTQDVTINGESPSNTGVWPRSPHRMERLKPGTRVFPVAPGSALLVFFA
ncbi:MAG TPA: hypothetical protein VL752_15685 [Acidisoma sp.]|uniref:hypothetical protein n=1 Tax=Acidisoma sp. TaxID=1872115 RepID=UPI002C135F41|nr:hypothetical protein [Acidisoma sp.]HTI02390.1 hypothetical protein [Acidisoma sp.]